MPRVAKDLGDAGQQSGPIGADQRELACAHWRVVVEFDARARSENAAARAAACAAIERDRDTATAASAWVSARLQAADLPGIVQRASLRVEHERTYPGSCRCAR